MNLSVFLKLVEIQTKVASLVPYSVGILFAFYRYKEINIINILLLLLSLLCIDFATTATNNLMDYKRAIKQHGYNFETHNAIVLYNLSEQLVIKTIVVLVLLGSVFGLLLVVRTGLLVLLIGMVSFAIGLLYSTGPIPISRTPFGEIFSGFFMGFFIFFLSVYVNIYHLSLIDIAINNMNLYIKLDMVELIWIFVYSIPLVLGISNIMLANNICDIEDDRDNKRYTLPIYIGKKNALFIFKLSYIVSFLSIILLIISGVAPLVTILLLPIFIPIAKFVKAFEKVQSKKDTFIISVKNFLLMGLVYIVSLAIGIIL